MKLQTTYPSNNYPIYVEHGAIDHISTYIDQFDQSFILIDEHVNQYLLINLMIFYHMKMYIKLLFQLVKRRKHLSNIKKH